MWVHTNLKAAHLLPPEWKLTQCLFGEHLLQDKVNANVALVESEKTAVICSLLLPEYTWLATGGKSQFNDRLMVLKGRKVTAFPDIDGYEEWRKKAKNYPMLDITISDILERNATPENATEWFMPSAGQLWDLLENLGKVEALKAQRTNDSGMWSGNNNGDVCSNLNSWLTGITGADRFGDGYNYLWSSSEYSDRNARDWTVYSDGDVFCYWVGRGYGYDVRPVLAF